MATTEDLLDRALVDLDAVHLLHDDDRGADPLVAQALHQKAVALLDEVSQVDAATLDDTGLQQLEAAEAGLRWMVEILADLVSLSAEVGEQVERTVN